MRIKMDCEEPEQQKHQPQLQLQQQQHQQQHQPQQQQQQSANKLYARKPQTSQQQQQQQQQQESSSDDDLSTTERKNLEFAQKLGYSEQSIHTALTRLGSEAKQNELLAELIKLTADAPRPPPNSNNTSNNSTNNSSSNNNSSGSLRYIVIDGSNVALSHGNNTIFSCRGIRICVDWFRQRGHRHITAFVPNWRKELANNNITEQELLYELEQERVLVFTPSRHLDGKRVSCYDDRFILKLAVETDGIVVSNDNYRDLLLESHEFRKVVQERLLMYSFVDDIFMPPDDPLGRSGPTLDMFLRSQTQHKMPDAQQQLCPYGKKCTYGQKCKFRHQATPPQLQRLPLQVSHSAPLHSNGGQQLTPNNTASSNSAKLAALARTKSNTVEKISQQQQQHQQLCHSFNSQLELGSSGSGDVVEPAQQLNRHKKLQRQAPQPPPPNLWLMLPPYNGPLQQQQQQQQLPLSSNNSSNSNYHHHQYLTRTPSAPLADQHEAVKQSLSMPAHFMGHLSASDSRINEELNTSQTSREEQRRLLRYHLSSLFPQHQVHAVLQLYPDETDAKTICAAILNLFPNN